MMLKGLEIKIMSSTPLSSASSDFGLGLKALALTSKFCHLITELGDLEIIL